MLRVFTKTRPILDVFRKKELVIAVDGSRSVGEIQEQIRRRLNLPPQVAAA